MKKMISVLLSVVLIFALFAVPFSVYATENVLQTPVIADGGEEKGENSDFPDEPEEERFNVKMYICATANSLTGHVWLYFENNSNIPVTVGYVSLQPGQTVSVGSLRNTRSNGGGTYYNGEAKMAAKDGKLQSLSEHTHSLEMQLNREQLAVVSEKIKSMNYYEMIFWNCGSFATKVWNSVSDKKVVHIVLPVFTILNMEIIGAQKGKPLMTDPDAPGGAGTYKQRKNGVEPADEKSFNISCVNF